MSTISVLKNYAVNEKARRQSNLIIEYKSKAYNPFDFINSTYLSLLQQAKDGVDTDVRPVVLPNDVWTTSLQNSDILEFMSLSMCEIQKHLDGFQEILNQIDALMITDTSQISPAWDLYLTSYMNHRHPAPTTQELADLIESLTLPIQSDWTQANSSALDYIKNKPLIPAAQIQSDWNQANSSALDYIKNKPLIPAAQIQSDWNQANNSASDYIKNKPSITLPAIQSSAARTLNSIFQISATRGCFVNYSVDVACSLSLVTGQSGTIFLEIASDVGFSTNLQEVARFNNANNGTLTIGLNLTQTVTGTLSGYIPAGYYVRLRTSNVVGTPTFTYRSGQEVLL